MLSVAVTGSTGRVGKGIVETLDHAGIEWIENLNRFQDEVAGSEGVFGFLVPTVPKNILLTSMQASKPIIGY
jgi:aspartate-semialdehyde dehydrogenase